LKPLLFILTFYFFNSSVYSKDFKEKTPRSISSLKSIISKFKSKDLKKELNDAIRCCTPSRFVGSKGHAKVIPYLIKRLRSLPPSKNTSLIIDEFKPEIQYAFDLYENDFKRELLDKNIPTSSAQYIKWDKFTKNMISLVRERKDNIGKNLIWEKKGSTNPDEVIIIGAHYDTVVSHKNTALVDTKAEMPGADDNASGVAILIGLAELINKINISKTIRLVFFDFEELGFLGSRSFVQKYKNQMLGKTKSKEKVIGYVNLEMLGHDSKSKDVKKTYGNMKAYIRKKNAEGYASDLDFTRELTSKGKRMTGGVKFEIVGNGFNSSDHIHFWEAGIPAVTFTQDWENDFNPRYHTSNDFAETLNLKTFHNSFQYIAGAVLATALNFK
jgi:Zn-dependent M28 family amino/carboxypeptidase